MIRQFRLINSIGNMISLNDENSFVHLPTGLGVAFENQMYNTNSNFIIGGRQLGVAQFTANIIFGDNSYVHFKKFTEFLNHHPYTLEYESDVGSYKRDCVLNSLTKSEIRENNVIEETLVLDFTTPYYKILENENHSIDPFEGIGKIYRNETPINNAGYFSYDYIYEEDRRERDDRYFHMNNESVYIGQGHGSPIEITINGPCVNPSWDLLQGSAVLQNDGFFLVVPEGSKLVVSSFPEDQKAILVNANGIISNVYQAQDMTKTNFITIPQGRSTLVFNSSGNDVNFKIREERVVI